jgi:Tfp pilus assembly protein FimT
MKPKDKKKNLVLPFFCSEIFPKQIPKPYQAGFSLVEIIIFISLLGIISAIAVPGMTTMMKSYRLKSATNELASVLQLARVTAIAQNSNSLLTFDIANQSYSVFSDNGTGGGTVNDGVQSGSEPTLKTVSIKNNYYNQVTMNAPTFGNSMVFTSQGTCNQNGSVSLQNNIGGSYQVVLSTGGSIKVVKP